MLATGLLITLMSALITTHQCEASFCVPFHCIMFTLVYKRDKWQAICRSESMTCYTHISIWITSPTLGSHFLSQNIEMLNKILTKPLHFQYYTGIYDH